MAVERLLPRSVERIVMVASSNYALEILKVSKLPFLRELLRPIGLFENFKLRINALIHYVDRFGEECYYADTSEISNLREWIRVLRAFWISL